MKKIWTTFECPSCREAFSYETTPGILARIEEMELKIGRRCIILVDCPHCPNVLSVDRETGRAEVLSDQNGPKGREGVMYDLTLAEQTEDKVKPLIAAGHELMGTDRAKAESLFREALKIRKREPSAWYNLGVCRYHARDFAEAEQCYRKALHLDPQMKQAWNNLGSMLLENGRPAEADDAFDRGIQAAPDYPNFYLGKANVRLVQGDIEGSRNLLEQAIRIDSQYAPAKAALRHLDGISGRLKRFPRGA